MNNLWSSTATIVALMVRSALGNHSIAGLKGPVPVSSRPQRARPFQSEQRRASKSL